MTEEPQETAWIAVDWGTSNLRVWIIGGAGQTLNSLSSDRGMGALQPAEFESALLDLIAPYLTQARITPVLCCGMVGARQGWAEADYLTAPCSAPQSQAATRAPATDPRIAVFILPGVKQTSPADVMRGEETQIAGYLQHHPEFDGVLCLPGTHTKWVQISAGEIVSFQTFMSGELFALLSTQSVLRHSVAPDGWDGPGFLGAIDDAMTRPNAVAAYLFGLRAGTLVSDLQPDTARARLSGLLIGSELGAARPYWLGQQVAIIGEGPVSQLYQSALAAQGLNAATVNAAEMTLAGLAAAYQTLKENTQ